MVIISECVGRAKSYNDLTPSSDTIMAYTTGSALVKIEPYTRGNYYRDVTYYIPTYYPHIVHGNNPENESGDNNPRYAKISRVDPSSYFDIKWILCKSMLYKIGYFKTPGDITTFVPTYIRKKAGQAMTLTFRESIARATND